MKVGERVTWFAYPLRERGKRFGTIVSVRNSARTGEEFVVEADGGGFYVVTLAHKARLLRTYRELKEGDYIYLPPTVEVPGVLGHVHSVVARQPGGWFLYLLLSSSPADLCEVPVTDPDDEVEVLSS